jgi:Rrf2 family protein
LKLTTKSEYALLALLFLARNSGEFYFSVQNIASAQEIPPKFLEQILLTLKRARYVSSAKGPRGGYRLQRPASEITLAEIIRLFDGALAPTESVSKYFYEPTPIKREKGLIGVFSEIRNYISDKLENTTLADV